MTERYDIAALKSRLGGIRTEENPALVKQKSRDFFWYSPILKRQLDHVVADIVVSPTSEAEVVQVLAACHELGIPVTPRGTGTGNYGQAMPLSGGVLLDLSGFNKVKEIAAGRYVAEPGAIMARIDDETRAHSRQELRLHPSTYQTASIGGFIAGGSGGVGSIKWGGLRDWGNIIRLKVATMEASPRILEFSGEDLHKVAHAYGTNGIITEVEMPLGPAYNWVDVIVGFDDLRAATEFANAVGEQDGLALKNLCVVAAPAPHDYFLRHRKFLPRDSHLVIVMAADFAVDALEVVLRQTWVVAVGRPDDLQPLPTLRQVRVGPVGGALGREGEADLARPLRVGQAALQVLVSLSRPQGDLVSDSPAQRRAQEAAGVAGRAE